MFGKSSKILMYNQDTGEVALTSSTPESGGGRKWNKFLMEGYKPICKITGINTIAWSFNLYNSHEDT